MQHESVKSLASKVLRRQRCNTACDTPATTVLQGGSEKGGEVLHDRPTILRAFKYRLDYKGPWLILLSTQESDTVDDVRRSLTERHGVPVEVRPHGHSVT